MVYKVVSCGYNYRSKKKFPKEVEENDENDWNCWLEYWHDNFTFEYKVFDR